MAIIGQVTGGMPFGPILVVQVSILEGDGCGVVCVCECEFGISRKGRKHQPLDLWERVAIATIIHATVNTVQVNIW